MISRFYPDLIAEDVKKIDLNYLIDNNIKGLILDIDNTLVPDYIEEAGVDIIDWLDKVKKMGFKVCIVSNASQKRVLKFNEKLGVDAISRASKPRKKPFLKAVKLMGIRPGQIAVIGDQVFTDIYGGNKLNMFTILVTPIAVKEFILVKMKRRVEKFVLARHAKTTRKELEE
ncbi:YqeG family HAD IIIA-type phosphatase [Herbivorax sp. ANBcel31]|uniref:YqeG family HAD IIIA-type phosphatase n=1 Tax=Herbivorax sp. ANBcel31 TaxID=3069754 RepID=UPI0027B3D6B2|nr:YqeG family HAD IIIA-type phosphatase [Herbivorax sp. ANBcel31]MDQ2086813.1 YqeG family HAD IIIA-type phosphatase [Herbivorax sp. ANBcel31]